MRSQNSGQTGVKQGSNGIHGLNRFSSEQSCVRQEAGQGDKRWADQWWSVMTRSVITRSVIIRCHLVTEGPDKRTTQRERSKQWSNRGRTSSLVWIACFQAVVLSSKSQAKRHSCSGQEASRMTETGVTSVDYFVMRLHQWWLDQWWQDQYDPHTHTRRRAMTRSVMTKSAMISDD
jgi:hypothetical protein